MTPSATMRTSQSTGAPARSALFAAATAPAVKRMSAAASTMPQAWTIRTATGSSSASKAPRSASARIMAKDLA